MQQKNSEVVSELLSQTRNMWRRREGAFRSRNYSRPLLFYALDSNKNKYLVYILYKRSAPRAADAARYAHTKKILTKCEGGEEAHD